MATPETQHLDEVIATSRRRMLALGGAALAGLAVSSVAAAQTTTLTDTDYLNFALNLEYLEGNYYSLAASGQTLAMAGVGTTGTGTAGDVTVKAGGPAACKVQFQKAVLQSYAAEIAADEQKHINFLRNALGSAAVAQPAIDLYKSFISLAGTVATYFTTNKIGVSILSPSLASFDPFADDISFLLGAYIFEVGVGAYTGAAPLLTDATHLDAAAGIQATEAYHYGLIRTQIALLDQAVTSIGGIGAASLVTRGISGVRAMLDGSASTSNLIGDDRPVAPQTVILNGSVTLNVNSGSTSATSPAVPTTNASGIVNASTTTAAVTTNSNGTISYNAAAPSGTTSGSLAPAITPAHVLAVVYAGGSGKGGFFPAGLNGNIK